MSPTSRATFISFVGPDGAAYDPFEAPDTHHLYPLDAAQEGAYSAYAATLDYGEYVPATVGADRTVLVGPVACAFVAEAHPPVGTALQVYALHGVLRALTQAHVDAELANRKAEADRVAAGYRAWQEREQMDDGTDRMNTHPHGCYWCGGRAHSSSACPHELH